MKLYNIFISNYLLIQINIINITNILLNNIFIRQTLFYEINIKSYLNEQDI